MLAATVYNQKGGQGKTTLTRDLAAGYARLGLDVLAIDLDQQNASLSNYLDVDDEKWSTDADSIARHLIDREKGPFNDLIRESGEGFDIIPSHKSLGNLKDWLRKEGDIREDMDNEDWDPIMQLHRVLVKADIPDKYDVILVDPNAKADEPFYLGLYATRSVIIPATATRSGYESISGVTDACQNFAAEYDISIGRSAVVPTMVDRRKSDSKHWARQIIDEYSDDVYVYFKDLGVFENAETERVSLFRYFDEIGRVRDYQSQILPKYRTLIAGINLAHEQDSMIDRWETPEMWTGDEFLTDTGVPMPKLTTDKPNVAIADLKEVN